MTQEEREGKRRELNERMTEEEEANGGPLEDVEYYQALLGNFHFVPRNQIKDGLAVRGDWPVIPGQPVGQGSLSEGVSHGVTLANEWALTRANANEPPKWKKQENQAPNDRSLRYDAVEPDVQAEVLEEVKKRRRRSPSQGPSGRPPGRFEFDIPQKAPYNLSQDPSRDLLSSEQYKEKLEQCEADKEQLCEKTREAERKQSEAEKREKEQARVREEAEERIKAEYNSTISQLKDQLDMANRKKDLLHISIKDLEENVDTKRSKISQLESEATQSPRKAGFDTPLLAKLQKDVEDAQKFSDEDRLKAQNQEERAKIAEGKVAGLEKDKEALLDNLNQHEQSLIAKDIRIDDLEKARNDLKRDHDTLKKDYQSLKSSVTELRKYHHDIDQLAEQNRHYKADLDKWKRLAGEREALVAIIEQRAEAYDRLKEQYEELLGIQEQIEASNIGLRTPHEELDRDRSPSLTRGQVRESVEGKQSTTLGAELGDAFDDTDDDDDDGSGSLLTDAYEHGEAVPTAEASPGVEELKKDLDLVVADLDVARAERKDFEDRLASAKLELENMTKERDELQEDLATASTEIEKFQRQTREDNGLRGRLKETVTELTTMTNLRKELETALTREQERLEVVTKTHDQLQEGLNKKTSDLENMTFERDELQEKLKQTNIDRDQLQEELQKVVIENKSRIKQSTEASQLLQQELDKVEIILAEMKSSNDALSAENTEHLDRYREISEKHEQLVLELDRAKVDLEDMTNQREVLKATTTEEQDKVQDTLNTLAKERNQLSEELGQAKTRITAIEAEAEEAQTAGENLHRDLARSIAERDHAQSDLDLKISALEQALSDLNLMTEARDQAQSDLNRVTTERDTVHRDLDFRTKEGVELQSQLTSMTKERDEKQSSVLTMTISQDTLQKDFENMKKLCNETQDSMAEAGRDNQRLKDQQTAMMNEKSALQDELTAITKERDSLRHAMDDSDENILAKVCAEKDAIARDYSKLKEDLENMTSSRKSLQVALEEIEKKRAETQQELDDVTLRLNTLRNQDERLASLDRDASPLDTHGNPISNWLSVYRDLALLFYSRLSSIQPNFAMARSGSQTIQKRSSTPTILSPATRLPSLWRTLLFLALHCLFFWLLLEAWSVHRQCGAWYSANAVPHRDLCKQRRNMLSHSIWDHIFYEELLPVSVRQLRYLFEIWALDSRAMPG